MGGVRWQALRRTASGGNVVLRRPLIWLGLLVFPMDWLRAAWRGLGPAPPVFGSMAAGGMPAVALGLGDPMPFSLALTPLMPHPSAIPPADQSVLPCVPNPAGDREGVASAVTGCSASSSSRRFTMPLRDSKTPKAEDEDDRREAILRWADLVPKLGRLTNVGRRGLSKDDLYVECDFVFEGKATATLIKRGTSLRLFLDWLSDASIVLEASSLEATCMAYAKHLEESEAPATRALSFPRRSVSSSALSGSRA